MPLHTLQERLAKSLDSANRRQANTHTPRPTPRPTKARGGDYLRLCISLSPDDRERIEKICSYLAARGERVTTSRAVKIALRTAPLSSDLTAALEAIKQEDGRSK